MKILLALPSNRRLIEDKLKELDWIVLQDLECILEVSYCRNFAVFFSVLTKLQAPCHAQHTMCGEWSPLFGSALPAYETFIMSWQ